MAGAKEPLQENRILDGEGNIRFVEANSAAMPGETAGPWSS